MKKGLTELVFILDRSGSMGGLESDTVGGFNAMIEKQKKEEGECLVSTVLFSNDSTVLHDRVPVDKVPAMTTKEYSVGGCTALLDAIGGAIHHIGNVHKYAREEDVPEHTMFVITTDGMENASREYSSRALKEMISRQKEQYGWEFVFVAANIDAVETAENIGISRNRAVNYNADERGTQVLYECVSRAVSGVRKTCAGAPKEAALGEDWREELDADYAARGGQNAAQKAPDAQKTPGAPKTARFGKMRRR